MGWIQGEGPGGGSRGRVHREDPWGGSRDAGVYGGWRGVWRGCMGRGRVYGGVVWGVEGCMGQGVQGTG